MPKVGGHVSAAVSLDLSIERAVNIGAEVTQIFISPPQRWLETIHKTDEILRYKDVQEKTKIGPNFIHGTYLINLGTQNPEHLQKSISWLIYAMNMASQLGMEGVIFHTGSHKGVGFDEVLPQIINALKIILKDDKKPYLILENAAGAGNIIGDKFSELGMILKGVNNPRLKICLDTCHSFAAGYDIKNNLDLVLEEFDHEVGLENLVAIHANDSKFELGQNKDRHANIGEGFIGTMGFETIINHPVFSNIPFILEVPGFNDTGPDQKNIDILKNLIHD